MNIVDEVNLEHSYVNGKHVTEQLQYMYTYNKMLPLSPGEFMRPFLLTFTLILWYINTIYLT